MTSMAESARPWRLFWAVPLPAELRDALAAFVVDLRGIPGVDDDWRFTNAGSWHITLAFLGVTEPATVAPMIQRVRDTLLPFQAGRCEAGGLGGFPRGDRARVLWYGIDDADGHLAAMAEAVQEAAGLEPAAAFYPHVTLARSRDRRGARPPVPRVAPPEAGIGVDEVVLFRSHLGAGPARYETVAQVTLRASSLAGSAS
ncbi:MAG TPA: RNA 2',3'-cyclic phosphodiesterase [Candidatus Limnocylindria bacterium]|nr:RNA 2',3'-cyclic phosphodiesterase [Candidatus Limnocylindria bacterium]